VETIANRKKQNMSGQKRHIVNGETFSSAVAPGALPAPRAVNGAMGAPASKGLLADVWRPCEPEGSVDTQPKSNVVAVITAMTPPAQRLELPAARIARTRSEGPQDAHDQALSQVRTDVAQTLHETVMQTLVATTFLAESPTTSRRDLVEYLRQATHELRCVIDGFAAPEASR
jgi:hypothetical protein